MIASAKNGHRRFTQLHKYTEQRKLINVAWRKPAPATIPEPLQLPYTTPNRKAVRALLFPALCVDVRMKTAAQLRAGPLSTQLQSWPFPPRPVSRTVRRMPGTAGLHSPETGRKSPTQRRKQALPQRCCERTKKGRLDARAEAHASTMQAGQL